MSTVNAPNPQIQEDRELIPPGTLLSPYISVNAVRMHGEPCFTGSRGLLGGGTITVKVLLDNFPDKFKSRGMIRKRRSGISHSSPPAAAIP